MPNAFSVFVSGITGVFLGMALLFFSIKLTSKVVDMLDRNKEGKK